HAGCCFLLIQLHALVPECNKWHADTWEGRTKYWQVERDMLKAQRPRVRCVTMTMGRRTTCSKDTEKSNEYVFSRPKAHRIAKLNRAHLIDLCNRRLVTQSIC